MTAEVTAMYCLPHLVSLLPVVELVRVRVAYPVRTDPLEDPPVPTPVQRPVGHLMLGWPVDDARRLVFAVRLVVNVDDLVPVRQEVALHSRPSCALSQSNARSQPY